MVDVNNIKGLSFSGHTLNVAERALLSAAIMKKSIEENLAVSFWGKIFGAEASYLVCVGIVQKFSGVPSKKFFYLVSGGENPSSELAEVEAKHPGLVAKDAGKPFSGVPDTVLREPEDEETEEAYTEAHRLAYTVAAIDQDTSVVPRGAFIVTPAHKVTPNRTFEGLNASSATSLNSFYHFREPVELQRLGALEKKGLVASTDFLDPLSGDVPKGSWALKFDGPRQHVTLSSLKYPGYHFFHRLGTAVYGGAYFGTGAVNKDLVFMI